MATVESEIIRIVLTGDPVAAGRPKFRNIHTKAGNSFVSAYTPAHMRKWQTDLRYRAQEEMKGRIPFAGELAVTMSVFLPIPQSMSKKKTLLAQEGSLRPLTRPDLDNYIKQLDALNGVCWKDDSQIVSLVGNKWYSDRPRVEITIEPIEMKTAPVKDAAATASLFPSG